MERPAVLELMVRLKLRGMRAAYDEVITLAAKRHHSPEQVVGQLLAAQLADTESRATAYRMGNARFPVMKTLGEFDLAGERGRGARAASEALRGIVERHQPEIRDVACRTVHDPPASADPAETAPAANSRRRNRCELALRLHGEGLPIKDIARRIGASRNAVRHWARAGRFVPYRRASSPSLLDRHLSFVEARWQAGERNATTLHRELCARGFTGGYDIVRRWAARRRKGAPAHPPSARIPSTRRITRWLTSDPDALSWEDRAFIDALCIVAPKLKRAAEDVRAFAVLLRQDDPAGLTPWLKAAAPTGLSGFVTGLRQDEAAVRAAIEEPWSNGPVEGQVNRLKLIKRSMYGRAKFDLLRQRVLYAA